MLKHKVVIISGASSGIGRAAAYACRAEQAKLVLHHIGSPQSDKDVAQMTTEMVDSEVAFVAGDIRDPKTSSALVAAAVERFGGVDVLVSNAGICLFSDFFDVTPELLKDHMDINYAGAFSLVQACAAQMKAQGRGGSIVAISSISALVGGGQQTHYTPTKAAILSMMQSCAVALGPYGIRCNAILPGTIQTGMNQADLQDLRKREYMASRCALGRLGNPEDIAVPIVFLASDMSAYMSGSQLLVDGGLFVNLQ
ncbi:Short-chain dehydrogenase [Taphrina deformans PYCC 5710]|uniref:Short-chain dehydrogenase n=1 Tax=Taphrina deformans (strain PYCC 5710 / ATCC 11124 / CBS 356.35 / IMI 108563 / JCM 9778 / NBRC 8474) TaxID=1097556 RepID=R4X8R3_TAPDE|nr:Short-chain dehydrogenase [Taphrina deformans PYCC 5710]|eukprot:CCG80507.1 Short-chain dehydrogenase [Taphrina deformans PYCC 5710]